MPLRRFLAALVVFPALLTSSSAFAVNDGQMCANPLTFLICLGAAAVAVPMESAQQFWPNRARAALEEDRIDDAVRIAQAHPEAARVDDLLRLQVKRVLATTPDAALQARRVASLDQLVAARPPSWGATPTIQEMLVEVADAPGPDATALLQRLLLDGLTSPDVSRYQLDDEKACPETTVPCPRLVLLLDHGLAGSPRGLAALLYDAVHAGKWGDAGYLLERGADPNVEGSGIAVTTIATRCQVERATTRGTSCADRRDDALRYLVAHGADVNGRPTAERHCETPLDIALAANDSFLVSLLVTLGADAGAGARCRAAAGLAKPAADALSRR